MIFLFLNLFAMAAPYRMVEMAPQDMVHLYTAMDHSTVIEFEEKPVTAVIGNPKAFSIEFVRQTVTIRPLTNHLSTNFIVFLGIQRYLFALHVDPSKYDALVTVKQKVPNLYRIMPKVINQTVRSGSEKLSLLTYFISESRTSIGFNIESTLNAHGMVSLRFTANGKAIFPVSTDLSPVSHGGRQIVRAQVIFRLADLKNKVAVIELASMKLQIPPLPGITIEYRP